jgi:hypothetical protein
MGMGMNGGGMGMMEMNGGGVGMMAMGGMNGGGMGIGIGMGGMNPMGQSMQGLAATFNGPAGNPVSLAAGLSGGGGILLEQVVACLVEEVRLPMELPEAACLVEEVVLRWLRAETLLLRMHVHRRNPWSTMISIR